MENKIEIVSIANEFSSWPLEDDQALRIHEVKLQASRFLELINIRVPFSREQSLAKTKLEECVMWATKAIAHETLTKTE